MLTLPTFKKKKDKPFWKKIFKDWVVIEACLFCIFNYWATYSVKTTSPKPISLISSKINLKLIFYSLLTEDLNINKFYKYHVIPQHVLTSFNETSSHGNLVTRVTKTTPNSIRLMPLKATF